MIREVVMKKILKSSILLTLFVLAFSSCSHTHSGKTEASGATSTEQSEDCGDGCGMDKKAAAKTKEKKDCEACQKGS